MPTIQNLKDAIDAGNVPRVAEILDERDAAGRPRVDINATVDPPHSHLECSFFDYVLDHARISSETRFRILEILLSIRDRHNNPVINLNIKDLMGANILEQVLSCGPTSLFKQIENLNHYRTLVYSIINLRFNDGRPVCNFSDPGWFGPLFYAVQNGDPEIVRAVVDLRNADGSLAIDVNRVFSWGRINGRTEFTVLDLAEGAECGGVSSLGPVVPNPEVIEILRAAHTRHFRDLPRRRQPQAQPATVVIRDLPRPPQQQAQPAVAIHQAFEFENQEINANEEINRVEIFNNNRQNVHEKEVEKTVDLSIRNLLKRYSKPNKKKEILEEIKKYIEREKDIKFYKPDEIRCIESGFNFIQNRNVAPTIHAPSGLNMLDVLSLVWIGANDKTLKPADNQRIDSAIIVQSRRRGLLDQFKLIITTYGEDPSITSNHSCLGGSRNRLLVALDKAHPDVNIATTPEAAEEVALDTLYRLEKKMLLELPREKQLLILSSWDRVEAKDSEAFNFHRGIRKDLYSKLEEDFRTIVPIAKLKQWTSIEENGYYDSLPIPIPHPELAELIKNIGAYLSKDPKQKKLVAWTQLEAEKLFSIDRGSYEEDCAYLKRKNDVFIGLKELLTKYNAKDNEVSPLKERLRLEIAKEFGDLEVSHSEGQDKYEAIYLKLKDKDNKLSKLESIDTFKSCLKDALLKIIPTVDIKILDYLEWLNSLDAVLDQIASIENYKYKGKNADKNSFSAQCAQAIAQFSINPDLSNMHSFKDKLDQCVSDFSKSEQYQQAVKDQKWRRAFAILKNVLLCFPIIGWGCLLYRKVKGVELFFPLPQKEAPIEKLITTFKTTANV